MTMVPEFVVDTLNGLLDAEVNNIFRVVADLSPHVARADPAVRGPIAELRQLSQRHSRELSDLIVAQGGEPRVQRDPRTGDENLGHLSLKFLLPKLVAEKDLILTRYENAKVRLGADFPSVTAQLARIEDEQRHFLDLLGRVAESATGGKYHAPSHDAPPRPAKGR